MQKKDSTINCVLSLLFNIIVYGALTYENSIFPDNNYAKAIWTFCGIYIWCMLMIAFYKPQNNKHCFNSNFLCILVIFEIGYAFYHLENGHEKWLVGHFDNPAGFSMFIVSCFPFFYNQAWGKQKKWIKHFIDFFFVIIILLTGSRTGIVAITVIIIFANLRKTVHLKIFKILTLTTILCTAIFLLYMIKKDSANGRILIWKCTYNMISQKPILGYGENGFKNHYMTFQEQYFAKHHNSPYKDLADNITHPFNEYLLILTNYGILGLSILLIVILSIYLHIRKQKRTISPATLSLLSISIYAIFSYPLAYPICWCILFFNIFSIIDSKYYSITKCKCKIFLVLCMLIAGINYAQNLSIKIGAYQKWKELYTHSFNETFDIQQYCDISIILHSDASFWYNFSAELYFRKKYQECLYALNYAAMLNNNTDIQILKGLCYQEMKDYCSAKKHYISAHNMCPKLFKPLYLLAKMYEQIGDTTRASKIAIQIINKKVKIQSFEIEEMKTDVKQLIIP